MPRLAAIDAGSTSVHLLVADVVEGELRPVVEDSVFAGLGEVVEAAGLLGEARGAELASLLAREVRRATDVGAEAVVVLGTAPLRRAADAARIVRRMAVHGIDLHVLSDREEALLTLLGATGGVVPHEGLLLVDVGGGSTEVVLAAPGRAPVVVALPIGAATLAGRHVTADPPLPEELAAMRAAAEAAVVGGGSRRAHAIAVGGTADNLARVAGTSELTREVIEGAVRELTAMPADAAAAASGVRVGRARLLPAGAAILLAVMRRVGIDAVTAMPAGLREGAILAVAATGGAWRDRLEARAAGAVR